MTPLDAFDMVDTLLGDLVTPLDAFDMVDALLDDLVTPLDAVDMRLGDPKLDADM